MASLSTPMTHVACDSTFRGCLRKDRKSVSQEQAKSRQDITGNSAANGKEIREQFKEGII